jgi:hypothetical protein
LNFCSDWPWTVILLPILSSWCCRCVLLHPAYWFKWVLAFCPVWPGTWILLISVSQVAGIIHMIYHVCFFLVFKGSNTILIHARHALYHYVPSPYQVYCCKLKS